MAGADATDPDRDTPSPDVQTATAPSWNPVSGADVVPTDTVCTVRYNSQLVPPSHTHPDTTSFSHEHGLALAYCTFDFPSQFVANLLYIISVTFYLCLVNSYWSLNVCTEMFAAPCSLQPTPAIVQRTAWWVTKWSNTQIKAVYHWLHYTKLILPV